MRYSIPILLIVAVIVLEALPALTKIVSEDSQANLTAGKAFLTANEKKEGVKQTASGLQYKILKEGSGSHPTATQKVTVHYQGNTITGELFDSSYDRGHPLTFTLSNVIPGWTEGLQLMKTGSIFRLFIPSELAYGTQGAGADIEPNATLIFDVELIRIH
jgi:FKBP-type peptidyl-prolyl cis-trans isomerase